MLSTNQKIRRERRENRHKEIRGQIAYYLTVSGYTKPELAEMLGMSSASFYNKLKNPDTFKLDEFLLLLEYLNLDAETKLKLIA